MVLDHRSVELKTYLQTVNQDWAQDMWAITCTRFAPNAPEQNPVEDLWLQAKRFVRQYYHLRKSFAVVKFLFEFVTHHQVLTFLSYLCTDLLMIHPGLL